MWTCRHKKNLWSRFLFCQRKIRYDGDVPVPPVQQQAPALVQPPPSPPPPPPPPPPPVKEVDEVEEYMWEYDFAFD